MLLRSSRSKVIQLCVSHKLPVRCLSAAAVPCIRKQSGAAESPVPSVTSVTSVTSVLSAAGLSAAVVLRPAGFPSHGPAGFPSHRPAGFPSHRPAGFPPVRWASSSSGVAAASGWYDGIADSLPVHVAEQLLLSVQQSSGLPWWASIVLSTLAVRTLVTLPLAAYQLLIITKVEALQAEIAELAKRLRYEVSVRGKERGWSERHCRFQFQKNLRRLVSQLYVRDNCHPFKASLLVWVQLPLWVSLSVALRNLSLDSAHSVLQAELAAGGALWFPDLTSPDSTWILPICLGLTNLLIVEVFSLQKLKVSRFQSFVTNFIRGISVLMIPIAATVPSSMSLYWLSSSLVGLAHNFLLRSPSFLRLCRLPPRSASPYRDLLAAFIARYRK